jgi:ABC-type sugar transport system substrate-binding protein
MRLDTRYRRMTALGAAAVLGLGVAACGGQSDDGPSGSGSATGAAASATDAPSFCGTKKIKVSLSDGNGADTWRRITRKIAELEAAKCPNVTKFVYTDGQANTQKAISDIQGLVAQGVNAMVIFPDAGKALLPAMRSAVKAGVTVVPYRSPPGGKAGVDYTDYVATDSDQYGILWGNWLVDLLPNGGNVLYLGGPAGVQQSLDRLAGLKSVLDKHPDIKLIGQQPFNVTNWDPAKTQQVITASLAKFPKIDAIAADYGAAMDSALPAFKQASRKIPPIATEDSNQLACDWKKLHKTNPDFQLYTNSSQNWMVRTAIQDAIAKAADGTPPASLSVKNATAEDSVSGKPKEPECDPSLPGDAILSSRLDAAHLKEVFK